MKNHRIIAASFFIGCILAAIILEIPHGGMAVSDAIDAAVAAFWLCVVLA